MQVSRKHWKYVWWFWVLLLGVKYKKLEIRLEKNMCQRKEENLAETNRGSYIQSKGMVIKIIRQ